MGRQQKTVVLDTLEKLAIYNANQTKRRDCRKLGDTVPARAYRKAEKAQKPGKRGRYGNVKKPVIDGHRFDSQREADIYQDLKLLQHAGAIENLQLQPEFPIQIGGVKVMLRANQHDASGRQMVYIADFRFTVLDWSQCWFEPSGKTDFDNQVIADVKMQSGHRDKVYKIKRALMEAMGYRITEL